MDHGSTRLTPLAQANGAHPYLSHLPQAVEAAQLAEDLKVQLEHVQTRLREIQPCLAESRAAREKESFNLKRAQVSACGAGAVQGRGSVAQGLTEVASGKGVQ